MRNHVLVEITNTAWHEMNADPNWDLRSKLGLLTWPIFLRPTLRRQPHRSTLADLSRTTDIHHCYLAINFVFSAHHHLTTQTKRF